MVPARLPARLVEVTADEDVVVAWDSANADLKAVLADPAICAAVFPTPFGPMPVDQMIDQLICLEILAHTWDLSRATGQDDTLNADAVEWVHNAVKTLDAVLRDPGIMGSKIESPAGRRRGDSVPQLRRPSVKEFRLSARRARGEPHSPRRSARPAPEARALRRRDGLPLLTATLSI